MGQAVSYRVQADGKGSPVFVTMHMVKVPVVTVNTRGAIGVELNVDHLPVSETDADCNWLESWRVP